MQFFTDKPTPVALIETLLWHQDSGYWLLDRHIERMLASARYFNLPIESAEIAGMLAEIAKTFTASPMRVRLLLDEREGLSVTATQLPPNPDEFRFLVAPERLDSQSMWLAHKTTNRAFYDQPRQRAAAEHGVDEVVFLNENGELTEGSITSLFIERHGILLTPPLSAGLLPGTLRAELLATGKAQEQNLTLTDLQTAEAIWFGNSVRGMIQGRWIKTEGKAKLNAGQN